MKKQLIDASPITMSHKRYTKQQVTTIKSFIKQGLSPADIADLLAVEWNRPKQGLLLKAYNLSRGMNFINSWRKKLKQPLPAPKEINMQTQAFNNPEESKDVNTETTPVNVTLVYDKPVEKGFPILIDKETPPSKIVVYSDHFRIYFE